MGGGGVGGVGKEVRGGLGWNIPSPSYIGVLLLIFLFLYNGNITL